MPLPDDDGPWRRQTPKGPGIGLILWLGLLALLGLAVWQLSVLFPGQLNSDGDQAYVIQAIAIIAFLSAGLIFARRINVKETARNIAIWVAIAAVLIVGALVPRRNRKRRAESAVGAGARLRAGDGRA